MIAEEQLRLSENVLLTVHCIAFGGVNSQWSQAGTTESSRLQYTAHSQQHITKKLSLKMTQQGRNM
jgi:hypothetical protein